MTTNETMLELLKLIELTYQDGPERCPALTYEDTWQLHDATGMSGILPATVAQAVIEKFAIEWLRQDDRTVAIYAPGYPTGEGGFYEAWWVGVYGPKEMKDMGGSFPLPVRDILAFEQGPTLLEALHAAVEESKDKEDGA